MDLSAIASNPDQKARQAQYLGVLEELVQRRDKDGVLRLASHVVSEGDFCAPE